MATCGKEIHLNDIGTVFRVTLYDCDNAVDLSTASVKQFVFKKPDESVVTKDAVFLTDGTDGVVQYVTIASDLDLPGKWKIQARVTLPTGVWSSDIDTFKVYANLD